MNHTTSDALGASHPGLNPAGAGTPALPMTTHGLEWLGPLAFTRRYAGRGVDRDFGDQWGPHRDQRLTVRHQLGNDHGLLYVYDATWGEYATLADDVSLQAVHQVTATAAALDPHQPVTHVKALLSRPVAEPQCPAATTSGPSVEL